jgi:uncharacterized membrane protein
MALLRSFVDVTAIASALLLAAPSARAGSGEISFCNEFPHKLYIAIAYLQTDVNNYLSRGWLEIETGKCYVFDTAIASRASISAPRARPIATASTK